MASLSMITFAPATVRVYAATATKGAGGGKEEKSLLDFILGKLTKQDQFYETDPIFRGPQEKSSGGSSVSGKKNSVATVPQKKKDGGGFGGLFAKKE